MEILELSLSDVSASISATEMLCAYLKEFGGEIVYGEYPMEKEYVNAFDEDYLSIQPSLAEQEDYEEDYMAERVQSEIDTK